MDKLTIARTVAAHPTMVKLTQARNRMFKRLRNDYGREFMGLCFFPVVVTEEMRLEEMENGHEGVNRWTHAERNAYFALENRIKNARKALTNHYANV